ncbi:hypothetical protein GUJ93_ZPchr0012g19429 [Zizania palustris]|uniref:Uncharacterized protein n=1 Tax=Zizania palustris TaxID=103762 RepID=A0A8J6BSU8_ZIZPA|nr:hypothetical protein GUJ93_ZPchr0012g19429 [Zizania palustris]
MDHQEALATETIGSFQHQASKAAQQRQQAKTMTEASRPEAVQARDAVAKMASKIEDLRQLLRTSEEGSAQLAELNAELRTTNQASDEAIKKLIA